MILITAIELNAVRRFTRQTISFGYMANDLVITTDNFIYSQYQIELMLFGHLVKMQMSLDKRFALDFNAMACDGISKGHNSMRFTKDIYTFRREKLMKMKSDRFNYDED